MAAFVFAIIFLLIAIALGIWTFSIRRSISEAKRGDKDRYYEAPEGPKSYAWVLIPLLFTMILGFASFIVIVRYQEVGYPVIFGKIQPRVLSEGLNFVEPWASVEKMNIQTHEFTQEVKAKSKDELDLTIEATLQWRLLDTYASVTAQKFGKDDYGNTVIVPAFRSAVRDAANLFTATEAYTTKREQLTLQIEELVRHYIEKAYSQYDIESGICVAQCLLRHVEPPEQIKNAIKEKLQADQEQQKMDFVLQKERKEAERKRIEAQGIADFQKIVTSGISDKLLEWKGIEATQELAKSPNAKIVIIGKSDNGLPVILDASK